MTTTGLHRLMPQSQSPGRRIAIAFGVLLGLTILGTFGFMVVEDLSFFDALYMAVITLSTVGYQDLAPGTPAGRIFSVVFISIGVGAALYAVASVTEFLVEGRLREALGRSSMERSIQELNDHVIVCGFGRTGRAVVEELEHAGARLVVIDNDESLERPLEQAGRLDIIGSALEESILRRARIGSARALVAALPSDADNVYLTLSARELNPEIDVHARAETEAGVRRLKLAGATQVISIHHLGGQRIANAIVRPAVVDFIELATPGSATPIDLEQVVLQEGCAIDGITIGDLADQGVEVSVVAITHPRAAPRLKPLPGDILHAGDRLVVVGDTENLAKLARMSTC